MTFIVQFIVSRALLIITVYRTKWSGSSATQAKKHTHTERHKRRGKLLNYFICKWHFSLFATKICAVEQGNLSDDQFKINMEMNRSHVKLLGDYVPIEKSEYRNEFNRKIILCDHTHDHRTNFAARMIIENKIRKKYAVFLFRM